MRVLMLSQLFPRRDSPAFAGFIQRQARELVAAGADVVAIAPMMYAPLPLWLRKRWRAYAQVPRSGSGDGLRVFWPRYLSLPGMKFHFLEGHTIRWGVGDLPRVLHAEKPFDVIHANRIFPEGFAALSWAKELGIPLIVMARGMDLNLIPAWGPSYRLALRHVVRNSDGILSVSNALFEDLKAIVEPVAAPTQVVYNGVDAGGFVGFEEKVGLRSELGLPVDKTLALYVGRLEPDKGTPELLRALGPVARRHADFNLITVGSLRCERYREDVERAGWSDRIQFLGERSHSDVQKIMRASDLFVFPSRLEGVPNSVLEAMGNGLPVIATRAGGIPEVVPISAGFLVDIGDVRGIEEYCETLLANPNLRLQMGEAGARHVAEGFSWQKNADNILKFYERVISMNKRPAAERWAA